MYLSKVFWEYFLIICSIAMTILILASMLYTMIKVLVKTKNDKKFSYEDFTEVIREMFRVIITASGYFLLLIAVAKVLEYLA